MVDTNVEFEDTVRLTQPDRTTQGELVAGPLPGRRSRFRPASSWADEYKRILKLFENNLK